MPSGEAGLAQRRRARWNLTFVIRARNTAAPLSVQKFLTFDGYWFHLLGYPGIRCPTIINNPTATFGVILAITGGSNEDHDNKR